jgi:hypothetical protein
MLKHYCTVTLKDTQHFTTGRKKGIYRTLASGKRLHLFPCMDIEVSVHLAAPMLLVEE